MKQHGAVRALSCGIVISTSFGIAVPIEAVAAEPVTILTGKAAMADWKSDAPRVRRKITVTDLPAPGSNLLAINPPRVAQRPVDARPQVPPGFQVELYASGFRDPRFLLTAPRSEERRVGKARREGRQPEH